MKLQNKAGKGILSEYLCELTTELDKLAKLDNSDDVFKLFHYIIINNIGIKEKCFAIRVYGGTVGGIWFDDNNIITKIYIDTDYVIKSYPANINETIQKYIGKKLEW